MRTALSLLSALLLSPATIYAQVEPQAQKALQQLTETISGAKTLSYHVAVVGEGRIFSMLPDTKGEVVAARPDENPKTWKMRVTGRSVGVAVDPIEVLAVADPTKWAWVDHPARQVVERFIGQERGNVIDVVNAIRIREIFEPQPLSKEIKCEVIKMEAPVELDGAKCDVVYVDQGKDQFKGRWFIAQTDHLPRKIEQIMVFQPGSEDKRVWTLTQIKLNAEPPAGSFAISTPDGYTFSPAAAPTPPTPAPTATPGGPATTAVPMKKDRAVGPNAEELAPDFELSTPAGEKVRLSSLRGNVVVVDFWGTWNLSSKKSTAEVQALSNQFRSEQVKFLGISVREGSDAAPAKFFTDNKLSYTLLLKGDEPAKAYRIKKYPTLFVIGREGEVIKSFAGYDEKSTKDIGEEITKALKATDKAGEKPDPAAPRIKGEPAGKGNPDADK